MRRGLKIFLGIIGVLAAAGLLFWLVFPGLPMYLLTNRLCSYRDSVLGEYPYAALGTPEKSRLLTEYGLQLIVPEGVEPVNKKTSLKIYTNKDNTAGDEAVIAIAFIDHSDTPDMELISEKGFTQEDFDRGMRGIRRKKPENNYECWDMIYNLVPAEYNYHKHGTGKFYLQVMKMKEELYPSVGEKGYHFENDTAKGFVLEYGKPDGESKNYALLIELYGKDNLNRCHGAIIKSEDYDILKQIANSARVVPE